MSYVQMWTKYLKSHRVKVLVLALALFSGIGLQLVAPQIVRRFIDEAAAGASIGQLTRLAAFFLGAALVNQMLGALSTYLSADVGWSATNALRLDLFRHALGLDMRFHKDRNPGELIERIDGDVTHLSNFFSQFVVAVTGSLLLVLGILILLWREDWRVGLVLSLYVVVVTRVLHRRREVAVPATQIEREANAQLIGFIEERLGALDDIRANGAGEYVLRRLILSQREWYHANMKAWFLRTGIWISMMLMTMAGHILVLALGVGLYQAGVVTLGTVYLFFNYMTMLEDPLDEFSRQMQEFQRAGAGFRRVRELLAEKSQIVDGALAGHGDAVRNVPASGDDAGHARSYDSDSAGGRRGGLGTSAHDVAFQSVTFSYVDTPEDKGETDVHHGVLRDVSFELAAGESMGLLGRTGSGKTTLIRLLFRFYDPQQGRILLDGVDLREMSVSGLRSRVGMVTQDVQLFEGTIRDNLTFFDPAVSDKRLMEVMGELGLTEWIAKLPEGLDTPLQAGGAGLSAGESQLLAFARAFLQDPGLVILDEPSSRLDPVTEGLLTRAIDRLLEGRTGIIVAHRLETVERVDKIMVLSQGSIVEFGDRKALAADPGSTYHAMLRVGRGSGIDEAMERMGV